MSVNVVECGDKIHVITRRLFNEDLRRHFVGEIILVNGELVEAHGYSFVYQIETNKYHKGLEVQKRVLSIGEPVYIVSKLPRAVDIAALNYKRVENRLVVSDSESFSLDINEFGPKE